MANPQTVANRRRRSVNNNRLVVFVRKKYKYVRHLSSSSCIDICIQIEIRASNLFAILVVNNFTYFERCAAFNSWTTSQLQYPKQIHGVFEMYSYGDRHTSSCHCYDMIAALIQSSIPILLSI